MFFNRNLRSQSIYVIFCKHIYDKVYDIDLPLFLILDLFHADPTHQGRTKWICAGPGIISKLKLLLIIYMSISDPRVENWFMMQSPWPSFIICMVYFIFVWISPTLMRNRKPMELREILIVYNLAMVALSSYTFYEVRICQR